MKSVICSGLAAGAPAGGAAVAVTWGNFGVIDGTGAFLGIKGQNGQTVPPPFGSMEAAKLTRPGAGNAAQSREIG